MTDTEGTEAAYTPTDEAADVIRIVLMDTGRPGRDDRKAAQNGLDALATLEAALQQARDERDEAERRAEVNLRDANRGWADSKRRGIRLTEAEATIERLRAMLEVWMSPIEIDTALNEGSPES